MFVNIDNINSLAMLAKLPLFLPMTLLTLMNVFEDELSFFGSIILLPLMFFRMTKIRYFYL